MASAASITETLPIEVIAAIIDNLAAPTIDKDGHQNNSTCAATLKDLKACSLACHDFLPLCQKHIFKAIELPTHNTTRFRSGVARHIVPRTSIARFAEVVETSPLIGGYVQKVILWFTDYDFEVNYSPDEVSSALRSLTKLRTIAFYAWTGSAELFWHDIPPSLISEMRRLVQLPTITTIELNAIQGFNIHDIGPCVGLETLILTDSSIDEDSSQDPSTASPLKPIQLITLNIGGYQEHSSLPKLMSSKLSNGNFIFDFNPLKTFKTDFVTDEDLQSVSNFLQQLDAPSLETIHLAFVSPIDDSNAIGALSLNGSIKTIKNLDLFFACEGLYARHLLGICALLQKLSSNNRIQVLRLHCRFYSSAVGNDPNWDVLNDILLGPGWSSLITVDLQFHSFASFVSQRDLPEANTTRAAAPRKLVETRLKGLSSNQSFKFTWNLKPTVTNPRPFQYAADL